MPRPLRIIFEDAIEDAIALVVRTLFCPVFESEGGENSILLLFAHGRTDRVLVARRCSAFPAGASVDPGRGTGPASIGEGHKFIRSSLGVEDVVLFRRLPPPGLWGVSISRFNGFKDHITLFIESRPWRSLHTASRLMGRKGCRVGKSQRSSVQRQPWTSEADRLRLENCDLRGAHTPPRVAVGALADCFFSTQYETYSTRKSWPARAPATTREGACAPRTSKRGRLSRIHAIEQEITEKTEAWKRSLMALFPVWGRSSNSEPTTHTVLGPRRAFLPLCLLRSLLLASASLRLRRGCWGETA
jgi:hypothetical protein